MNLTAIHLIPILIAFAAFVFWMKGNFQKNKTLVAIGVALTIIGFILLRDRSDHSLIFESA